MSETSREFWRNPARFARTEVEAAVSAPDHYLEGHTHLISAALLGALKRVADKNWTVLEIGCSCGRNIGHLMGDGYKHVAGVELNPEAVESAWEVHPRVAERIKVSDAQSFLAQCRPASWDIIYTQSLLMHIPPEEDYLFKQMARVAGKIILTCEVELAPGGPLARHKWGRNYKNVFVEIGWKQVYSEPNKRRTIRVFKK